MRAAIYMRVSSDEAAEKGTIENQRRFAKGYCDLNGIEISGFYADEGVSGTVALSRRPEGQRLLDDAHEKRFETILVYRIDRLGRSLFGLLEAMRHFDGIGVSVRSMTEPFDTETPLGRFVMQLLGMLAELERETIRERCEQGRKRLATDGKWVGGTVPFGYRLEERRLAVHEPEAETVRAIFDLYITERRGQQAIADLLTARGILTPAAQRGQVEAGRRWNSASISKILRDTAYAGEYRHGKVKRQRTESGGTRLDRQPAENHIVYACPAIVDRETFDRAQDYVRIARDLWYGKEHYPYLLTGLIRCGVCGKAFVGAGQCPPSTRHYYRCGSVYKRTPCGNVRLWAEEAEQTIWADVLHYIHHPEDVIEQVAARLRERERNRQQDTQALSEAERELSAAQTRRNRIVDTTIDLIAEESITRSDGARRIADTDQMLNLVQERRDRLAANSRESEAWTAQQTSLVAILDRLKDCAEHSEITERREALETLVTGITVFPDTSRTKRPQARLAVLYWFDSGSD